MATSEHELKGTENEREVVEQARFYNDKYASILLLLLLLGALGAGLFGLLFLLRSTAFPAPTYFPATDLGQLLQETPLDQANIGDNVLLNWVTEGMMTSHTFNFMSYNAVMTKANEYFTPEGYANYKDALTKLKIIDRVLTKKLVLKATPTDAPQILLEKPFAGRYLWKIRIPMRFRYQNVTSDEMEPMAITIIVMKVPTSQSPTGVLILKYEIEALPRT